MFRKWIFIFLFFFSDTNYFFTEPQAQYIAKHTQDTPPFRQSSPGFSYEIQSDLDTSDVPIHLRRTLPKYRFTGQGFTTKEPARYQNNPEYAYTFQPSGITSKLPQRKSNNPEYSRNFPPVSQNASPFRPSVNNFNIKPSPSSTFSSPPSQSSISTSS